MATKEENRDCPLCGEKMRRKNREVVDRIPGIAQPKRQTVSEWICPECDHFEEVEDEERQG